ncbi:MAG: TIM barrel protein [Acidobacteriota bacterium]
MQRRQFLATVAAAGVAAAQSPALNAQGQPKIQRKGRLKQALFRQVFGQTTMSLDDQCRIAADLGCVGFDLIGPSDWPTLKKYGLIPTMAGAGPVTFPDGLIHKEVQAALEPKLKAHIDLCAEAGVTKIITVGGQRKGMSYAEGADNAVAFLDRIKSYAESKRVVICLENMNTRYPDNVLGRPDQICDHVSWGFEVCKRVNSPSVKMLFDIYHAQVMDGNVCDTIKDNLPLIAHFHTAGVPGRHELDDTQELNYRFVAKTIVDLGFTGYLAHEYRPTPGKDPIEVLKRTLDLMDV